MTTVVITDPFVSIDGNDMSAQCTSVELTFEADELDDTAFGSGGWRTKTAGLKNVQFSVNMKHDFANSAEDDLLFAIWNTGSNVTVIVRQDDGLVGSSNPQYSGSACPTSLPVISGSVGEISQATLSWPGSGTWTRAEM